MALECEAASIIEQIWQEAIPDEDGQWVIRVADQPGSHEPLGDYGPFVRSILDADVSADAVACLARVIAYEASFATLYVLDGDPCPGGHESLLSADPTGREMRPSG